MDASVTTHTLGWIGTGRMGFPMAARLAKAGGKVAAYNRTRSKAEPLSQYGATTVAAPADLADRDIVFTMVSTSEDLLEVTLGQQGVLSRKDRVPKILVDFRPSRRRRQRSSAPKPQSAARNSWRRPSAAMEKWSRPVS